MRIFWVAGAGAAVATTAGRTALSRCSTAIPRGNTRGVAAKEVLNVRMGWAVTDMGRAMATGCFAAVNADIFDQNLGEIYGKSDNVLAFN